MSGRLMWGDLTPEQRAEGVDMLVRSGWKQKDLADWLGVSPSRIRQLIDRHRRRGLATQQQIADPPEVMTGHWIDGKYAAKYSAPE